MGEAKVRTSRVAISVIGDISARRRARYTDIIFITRAARGPVVGRAQSTLTARRAGSPTKYRGPPTPGTPVPPPRVRTTCAEEAAYDACVKEGYFLERFSPRKSAGIFSYIFPFSIFPFSDCSFFW